MQEWLAMTDIPPDTDPASPPTQPVVHVDALPAGTRLAEFEIRGLLGVGGFGLVYRAYDHSLHRTVAIKEYMPAALAARPDGLVLSVRSSSDQATYQYGLQSFIAEARLLAQFDHPSLVKVYRFWEANNTAYMVMPLYSGMTLKQARSLMAAPPSEDWLRTVLWSILQALQVLHEHDTLHRDVSPDNIFLQDVGPPVLLDLGAARRAIGDRSRKLTAILKVNYAPIEQYAEAVDLKQGPWTDLYSLAAAVYSCLCNDPPLPATARAVRDSLLPVRQIVGTVKKHFGLTYSESFVRTIQHALALQPADRPQSLAAFVTEMKLSAPSGLGKFDWRAALGAELLPSAEASTASGVTESVHAQGRVDAATTVVPQPAHADLDARSHGRRLRPWMVGALLGAVALLAGALLYTRWGDEVSLVAVPEPAAMPAPVTAQAPASGAMDAVDARDPAAQAQQPVLPATLEVASGVSAPTSSAVAAKAPAASAKKPATKQPIPDRLLCADSSFVMRPVCIYRQCLKPENAKRPICIEQKRRNLEAQPQPASP